MEEQEGRELTFDEQMKELQRTSPLRGKVVDIEASESNLTQWQLKCTSTSKDMLSFKVGQTYLLYEAKGLIIDGRQIVFTVVNGMRWFVKRDVEGRDMFVAGFPEARFQLEKVK